MTDALGNYLMAEVPGVEPIFVRAMLIGASALTYLRAVPDLTMVEAYEAATATWDTDWPVDPAPRDFAAAREAAESDLEYWED